jgi:hypothetical protein
LNQKRLYDFDLTAFSSREPYPSSGQARGHASLENAIGSNRAGRPEGARPLRPGPISIDRVSQENADAHYSKDSGDRFQHRTHPVTQRLPEKSNRVAQSKGF